MWAAVGTKPALCNPASAADNDRDDRENPPKDEATLEASPVQEQVSLQRHVWCPWR